MGAQEFGQDLLRRLLDHCVEATPGAVGAGLVVGGLAAAGPRGRRAAPKEPSARVAAAVGVAVTIDQAQVACGEGPALSAMASGSLIALDATSPDEPGTDVHPLARYPTLLEHAESQQWSGVAAVVATPGEWGGDLPVVLTIYLQAPVPAEQLNDIDRWESLLSSALAVVEYCTGEEMRAEQMLQMIQYRRVVEQAKGMIMSVIHQDAQTAFAVLSRASQHFNVRLRNLAVAMVEHVGTGDAEHPDDPEAVIHPTAAERRVAAQVWSAISRTPPTATTGPGAAGAQGSGHGAGSRPTVVDVRSTDANEAELRTRPTSPATTASPANSDGEAAEAGR